MTEHEPAIAANVIEKLSRELDEDYVGLWKVAWHIRRAWPDVSDGRMHSLTALILTTLLKTGVRLGDLDSDSEQFRPWPGLNSVEAATEAWAKLGRDPNIGEVAWLARLP